MIVEEPESPSEKTIAEKQQKNVNNENAIQKSQPIPITISTCQDRNGKKIKKLNL